ncbi:MAG: hypothetical protein L0241_27865 [Planctomycetia bacterium]|nr:hypothetical protein [Planctomycetia bacterium]
MTAVWQFLLTHLEAITLWTSIFAATAGFIALCLVWQAWSWLSQWYREFWAKCAVAGFRAIAAVSAVAAKAAPTKVEQPLLEQPWVSTLVIAAAGYLFWEVAGAIGDHRYKAAKEKTAADYQKQIDELKQAHQDALEEANQDRDDARFQTLQLTWLLAHLRELANEKRQRVRRVVQATASARASIQQVRTGLDPAEQVHILLEWLAFLFHVEAVHTDSQRHNQNFRVGLFAEKDGRLEPLDAFDLATRQHDPFSSYQQHADRYRFDNTTNPSHAVRCVREGRTLIVADCAEEPGFEFFHDRERNDTELD